MLLRNDKRAKAAQDGFCWASMRHAKIKCEENSLARETSINVSDIASL
jgi:hypothetical protein